MAGQTRPHRQARRRRTPLLVDVHNAVGVFAFVFLFVLCVTGIVIGFERTTTPWLYRMTASQPVRGIASVAPDQSMAAITADDALAIARVQLPGAVPVGINVPGPKSPYRVALRFPEDRTPGGRSRVYINPHGGHVLQVESSRTTAAGARLVNLNRAIHTGDYLGVPSKIVMSLASLAAAAQVVSGAMMWWRRRPSRRQTS